MSGQETFPPENEPAPPESKKIKGFETVIVVGALIGIFVVVLALMGVRTGDNTPRPTSTPTPLPTATPTFSEWKAQAEEIPYKTLFRYAEENTGKLVYYEGNVVQVIEGRGGLQLRVNVTLGGVGLWTDIVFLRYADPPVRVLDGDLIEFIGRMNGTITYESIFGADVTIPDITVLSLTINSE